jgi:hypothetical protein
VVGGHVATWRHALGDSSEAIGNDYDSLVVRIMEEATTPAAPEDA